MPTSRIQWDKCDNVHLVAPYLNLEMQFAGCDSVTENSGRMGVFVKPIHVAEVYSAGQETLRDEENLAFVFRRPVPASVT